jgi:hypothetical protein
MAHFAHLNEINEVTTVSVLKNDVLTDSDGNEQEQLGIDFLTRHNGGIGWYKQTSYNCIFRKNYAGIGFTYDATRDAFIAPQPYVSWTLVEDTCQWTAPTAYPDDGKEYSWNEATTTWVESE